MSVLWLPISKVVTRSSRYRFIIAGNGITLSTCMRIVKCLWSLGLPDQALAYSRQLLAVISLQVNLVLRAVGLVFAAIFYSFLRDAQVLLAELGMTRW